MARIPLAAILQVSVLVLISSTTINCFSLEDRLQLRQLTEDYMKDILAVKDAQLMELESKVTRLEVKVIRLEETVQQQDLLINKLQKEIPSTEFIPSHLALNGKPQMGKAVSFPRTCRELRAADPTLSSGLHWIDPDGQGVGDDPIHVYCDMIKGSTSVLHDTESATDIGHCADPGCYSRPVIYNATMRQMIALADLSAECHQYIQYDCNFAPLEITGITYAWWNDRNGTARYFWAGANSSVHTCQCGIDNNCVEPSMTCNCDSAAPVVLTDKGFISDKSFLPITRLNFGRTQLASSSGIHTLGRMECTGQVAVNGMPKSCTDLWSIGHSLSGLYSVMGMDQIESVYCDFSKLPTDPGFQKWIGYNDIKSLPVYFYVQRNSHFYTIATPISFNVEILNVGNAMNLTSGKFTAPRTGTYTFSFTGWGHIIPSSIRIVMFVHMYLNGNVIATGLADDASNTFLDESFSFQSTLNLKLGDNIWLEISSMSTGMYLIGGTATHFSGWLLEENISQSPDVVNL